MSTNGITTPQANTAQVGALQGLLDYCNELSVYISPSIAAQSYPGRGLGVYTLKPIKKGEKLVHIPTKSLLTTRNIPESFLSKSNRKRFTVHCALAAYLAFGDDENLAQYRRWVATWPKIEDFIETIPVFWLDDFRKSESPTQTIAVESGKRARKRRKTLSNTTGTTEVLGMPRFSRALGLDDHWLTIPTPPTTSSVGLSDHLSKQADKIRACIDTIDKYFPSLSIREPASHETYLRFLYMWSCINTRCFYYLRPGQNPPADSNEAMALCPFQDLFNHSDAKGCVGSFDKRGFFVRADKDYKQGEELFLRYGKHGNDMLWMEYGFMMDNNKDDEVKMDRVVLGSMSDTQKGMLEAASYRGCYTLKSDGVCYRTTIASYLGVLDDGQWRRMVSGGFDPEASTAHAPIKLRARRRMMNWILLVRREAEQNLKVLHNLTDEAELIKSFVCEAPLTKEQQSSLVKKHELAQNRKAMCMRRWMQVFDMCMAAATQIEAECPGAFLIDGLDGRSIEDLQLEVLPASRAVALDLDYNDHKPDYYDAACPYASDLK